MNGVAKLAMALGLAEWDTAYTHLCAMERMGLSVPPDIKSEVGDVREDLRRRWRTLFQDGAYGMEVEQARAYLTRHLPQVEELLKEGT